MPEISVLPNHFVPGHCLSGLVKKGWGASIHMNKQNQVNISWSLWAPFNDSHQFDSHLKISAKE